jgi:3-hydroxybutyrate dehydrogenase
MLLTHRQTAATICCAGGHVSAKAAEELSEKQPSLEFTTPEQLGALATFLCS